MVKKLFVIIFLALLGLTFFKQYQTISKFETERVTKNYYLKNSKKDTNSQNVVTSIVVSYRGVDTLGEVTILFLSALVVSIVLKRKEDEKFDDTYRDGSDLLKTASKFLFPVIILLGSYIFIFGHLTPGGGFQGGAVIASGFLLIALSNKTIPISKTVLSKIEGISGSIYILIGVLGIVLYLALFDAKFIPVGRYGELISAGVIPIIYILIGLKVGAELSSIIYKMKQNMEVE